MAKINSVEKEKVRTRVAELSKKKSALLYNFYENVNVVQRHCSSVISFQIFFITRIK